MAEFDILVTGSGPAGAAAAFTAARAGLRTGLIDRASFPRDKLCGGGVTGRALAEWRRVFGTAPPDMLMLDRVEFRAFGAFGGRIEDAPPIGMTMRRDFDAAARALALAAGAEPIRARVDAVDPGTGEVTLEGGEVLTARMVIGADGVRSAAARSLLGRSFDPEQIGFAYEFEAPPGTIPDTHLPAGTLRIDFGAARGGYGWTFPKRQSVTVGVGGVQRQNPDLRARLEAYAAEMGLAELPRVKGHHVPFGDFPARPGRGRLLLAGDAAGLVDPMTGEGIAHALTSGHAAAEAAIRALGTDAPESADRLYFRALRATHRDLRIARRLRWLVYSPFARTRLEAVLQGSGTLRRAYLRQLAGEMRYPQFLAILAARAPAMALRILRK